ncbi:dihydrofolate reductase [Oleiagrimonas sp.]|jgi:dihydrofolate reductase|uniref:dihydrofolate reductase n=1 Tax=Oleiagrimonas sp. TaxID=2010330 RepID=UPI00262F6033|nr:dihydrofolate reductase [Oleiagrimonas sp.]MDA3914403.1 dihydrofolate reductase [Oleiagrimonas sp.]
MSISLIAALDNDTVIGKNGQMPWHLPDDLKRFKELTIGKHVLMGYNTAISIGRALPERTNLVLSRRHTAPFPGQETVRSIPEAQVLAGGTGLMVIGGGEVYRETLPFALRMYLTWVDTQVEGGDVYFPHINYRDWSESARVHHRKDEKHAYAFDMVEYVRE